MLSIYKLLKLNGRCILLWNNFGRSDVTGSWLCWFSLACCRHMKNEPVNETFLSGSLSLWFSNKMKTFLKIQKIKIGNHHLYRKWSTFCTNIISNNNKYYYNTNIIVKNVLQDFWSLQKFAFIWETVNVSTDSLYKSLQSRLGWAGARS